MPTTVEINVSCAPTPAYSYNLYFADVETGDCATACSTGTPVTVESPCSVLDIGCPLYNPGTKDINSFGYYSDGVNCYYQGVYATKFVAINSVEACSVITYYYRTAFTYSCSTCNYLGVSTTLRFSSSPSSTYWSDGTYYYAIVGTESGPSYDVDGDFLSPDGCGCL